MYCYCPVDMTDSFNSSKKLLLSITIILPHNTSIWYCQSDIIPCLFNIYVTLAQVNNALLYIISKNKKSRPDISGQLLSIQILFSGKDRAAAYDDIAEIQHYRLTRSDRPLRLSELNVYGAVRVSPDRCFSLSAVVARARGDLHRLGRSILPEDPVEISGGEPAGIQSILPGKGHGVVLHIFRADVHALPEANSQPLALTYRVPDDSGMLPDNVAVCVKERPVRVGLSGAHSYELRVVTVGNEADVL